MYLNYRSDFILITDLQACSVPGPSGSKLQTSYMDGVVCGVPGHCQLPPSLLHPDSADAGYKGQETAVQHCQTSYVCDAKYVTLELIKETALVF